MCFNRKKTSDQGKVCPKSQRTSRVKFKKEDDVYVLTEKNFDDFLNTHPTFLADFYSPTCVHCKNLAPNYSKAATLVSIPLVKIDGTVEKNLADRFEVTGYPTLLFWKDGNKPIPYDGGREVDEIVSWIQSHTSSKDDAVVVLTTANFDQFVNEHGLCLVDFYAPWCGHCKKLAPEFEKAASKLKEQHSSVKLAKVDCTVEKDLDKRFDIQGYPTVILLKYGNKAAEYGGERKADAIVEFMIEQSGEASKSKPKEGVVAVLTDSNFDEFVKEHELCLVDFYAPWCGYCKKLAPEYEKAAQALQDEGSSVKLGKVDCTVERGLFKRFNIKVYPTLKVIRRGKAFDYGGTKDADGIHKYMHEQEKAAPSSEKEPASESVKQEQSAKEEQVQA